MSTHAKATFEVKSWDEKPCDEFEGGSKITRARVIKSFQGDIEGEGTVEYLMFYREDGSAGILGWERVAGRVGGRSGSFVLKHEGTYQGGVAEEVWSVVPGSGTGELRGMRGDGYFSAGHQQRYAVTLDYHFE